MSTENYDLDSLFHPKVEMGSTTTKNTAEYSPSADKGQNGVYKSIIRFVGWWQDPEHSYTDKWVCWLVDPVTNRGRMVDCPSSVGQPSPLQDMFFKLRKSESVQEQKKAEIFSRKHQYAAIVQVIKDDQYKEAEGKLLIYRFGKKIFEKYESEKKPIVGEPNEPFDLIDGKAFALVITKVAGFNNYDQSRFLDKKIPLLIPSEDGKLVPINERTSREDVFNFLKENSPDLSKYKFREWTQETHDYVNQVITAVTGQVPSTGYAGARNAESQKAPAGKPAEQSSGTGITTSELSLDELDSDNSMSDLPDLDLPEISEKDESKKTDVGLAGDLDDAIANL